MVKKALSFKQKSFAHEYAVDFHGKQAALRAGYSNESAAVTATNLLKDERIQALIARLSRGKEIRNEITVDRVLKEYGKIAFFDVRELYDDFGKLKHVQDLSDDTIGAIVYVNEDGTISGRGISMADKKAALDSIARHLGMFNDKLSIGGQPNNPLKIVSEPDLSGLTDEQLTALRLLAAGSIEGVSESQTN